METIPCNVLQDPPSADCHWTSQLLHSRGLQNKEETIDSDRSEPRRTHTVVYLCCDESQGMEFNMTLKSSREPVYNWRWYLVPFPDGSREEGMLVCVLLGSQGNSPGCVTNLLNSLQWESLQQRRWKQSLVMCYKIHHQLIAIEPANYYTAGR
jgi:hypothetical protein